MLSDGSSRTRRCGPPRPSTPRRNRDDRVLARRARAGDRQAREELVTRYLPLARALALRYRRKAEPVDDLVQVAAVGLIKAIDRWDPDRGIALLAFAVPTVHGELRHYLRDCTWAVRPPRRLQDVLLNVERSRDRLRMQLGRSPSVGDLAGHVESDEDTVLEALRAAWGRIPESLDAPLHDDAADGETVGDRIPLVDRELDRVEDRATVEHLTSILDARAREVVRLRYEEDLLQSEIAVRLGASQMQVSRSLRSSLAALHAYASSMSRMRSTQTASAA
jgi:RNA polymerase sigma-B factor